MWLFLLFSLPLFAAVTISFWKEPLKDIKYIILTVLVGLLIYLVSALLASTWNRMVPPGAGWFSRYFHVLLTQHGIYILLASLGAALLHLRKTIFGGAGDHFRELLLYFSGFFTGMNIRQTVFMENWYGFTELFLSPLLTIAAVIICAFLLNRFLSETDTRRYLWAGLVGAAVFVFPLILLPSWFRPAFLSPVFALSAVGGALCLLLLEIRGSLPGSSVRL